MPTYDYRCDKCEHRLESFQKITDDPLKTCPQCGKNALLRIPSGGIGLSFKGSGFYQTDYASKRTGDSGKAEAPSKTGGECCPCGKNAKCSA